MTRLLSCLLVLSALHASACTGTETGNPEAPERDGGAPPLLDAGGTFDGGATLDAGVTPTPDGGVEPPQDAGQAQDAAAEADACACDSDGG